MLVLMTTSNYPDIMLAAYEINRWNCVYFISYLVIGLFLIMKLLLGVFYSNFKTRFEEKIERGDDQRTKYLYGQFLDLGGTKGFLIPKETYKMFILIHGLATNTDIKIEDDDMSINLER